MKNILKNIGKLALLLAMVSSCQDDDKTFGSLDAPKNIELTYEIVGKDAEHPDGDGSGKEIGRASCRERV